MMKPIFNVLIGAGVVLAAGRTTPPDGCLHVAKSGGTYSKIQAAVDSLSTTSADPQCIFIDQGVYNEQVKVVARKAQLTMYGYTADTTSYKGNKATISYGASAASAGGNDQSGTLRILATNFKLYNVNVINTYGHPATQSQAIALSAQATSGFFGSSFYGFQDTLLANKGNQYYKNCLITGATDFIFGENAVAWFETCDVRVRNGGRYITASGRDSAANPSWYVFNGGTIDTSDNETVEPGRFYLGRPWKAYARTVFQHTAMSAVINPAGWSIWTAGQSLANVYYREYGNTGPGAQGNRVSWAGKLDKALAIDAVLGSGYSTSGYYDGFYGAAANNSRATGRNHN